MRILYVSEIVGRPGLFTLKTLLPSLKEEYQPDVILGCADGASNGFGLNKGHMFYLKKLGLDIITLGDCAFHKKDLYPLFPVTPWLLRPANLPSATPGKGWKIYDVAEKKLAVINLLGQNDFQRIHADSPFGIFQFAVKKLRQMTPFILIDFHAATTAEKRTFFYHADAQVSAVIGSHAKVLTADAQILDGGTGVITDAGRTGSHDSVGGFLPQTEIKRFLTGILERSEEDWSRLVLEGVLLDLDQQGKTVSIQSIRKPCLEVPSEATRNHHKD